MGFTRIEFVDGSEGDASISSLLKDLTGLQDSLKHAPLYDVSFNVTAAGLVDSEASHRCTSAASRNAAGEITENDHSLPVQSRATQKKYVVEGLD